MALWSEQCHNSICTNIDISIYSYIGQLYHKHSMINLCVAKMSNYQVREFTILLCKQYMP